MRENIMRTNQSATINVLDGKFLDYEGKIDIDYFTGEVVNYATNVSRTLYLYEKLVNNRKSPVHSIAWQALTECVNEELRCDGLQCTSAQLKKWFTIHGYDYKEAMKPVITKLTEEREEMLAENEND